MFKLSAVFVALAAVFCCCLAYPIPWVVEPHLSSVYFEEENCLVKVAERLRNDFNLDSVVCAHEYATGGVDCLAKYDNDIVATVAQAECIPFLRGPSSFVKCRFVLRGPTNQSDDDVEYYPYDDFFFNDDGVLGDDITFF